MANSRRKRKTRSTPRRRASTARRTVRQRARASNPMYKRRTRRRKNPRVGIKNRHHRRRRNPGSNVFGDLKGLAFDAGYLAGGGVITRSLPQLLVPQYNTGFLGYGLNLLTATLTSTLIGKWRSPSAGRVWLLGGFAFTLSRIIDDYAGLNILTFAQFNPSVSPALSGDPRYGMAGMYANVNFPLPSNSYPALPAGASATPLAVNSGSKAGVGWDGSYN